MHTSFKLAALLILLFTIISVKTKYTLVADTILKHKTDFSYYHEVANRVYLLERYGKQSLCHGNAKGWTTNYQSCTMVSSDGKLSK